MLQKKAFCVIERTKLLEELEKNLKVLPRKSAERVHKSKAFFFTEIPP
jgi:hypothetical protein